MYKRNLTFFCLGISTFQFHFTHQLSFVQLYFCFHFSPHYTTLHTTSIVAHQQSLQELGETSGTLQFRTLHYSTLVYSTVHPVLHTILHSSTHIKCKMCGVSKLLFHQLRAVGRSENPGEHAVIHGLLKEKVLLLFLENLGGD